ncbi:MAG: hypothetical protein MJ192_07715 [Clostridia bacterium]|nr:hypothetical protein [Clostridia bacterium]
MKFSRILCALLAMLFVLSLAACGGNVTSPDFSFRITGSAGEAVLTPGQPVGTSLDGLGTYEYSESGSCGGIPGNDEVYRFAGFTVYTTPGKKDQLIAKIELTDDTYTTSEGVRVGDSRESVIEKMGTGEETGDNLVYYGGQTRLTFLFRNDAVVGISYTEQ